MNILVATEKPFAAEVTQQMRDHLQASGHQVTFLEKYQTQQQFVAAMQGVDALIVRSDLVDKTIIDAGSSLKVIVRAGSGYDTIDVAYARTKGVRVANTPGQNANAVAELLFALLLYKQRNAFDGSIGSELRGKHLGLHAFGYVGRAVAIIAKGFGMSVCVYDPFMTQEQFTQATVRSVDTLEELYANCDIISVHVPFTPQTKGVVNKKLFSVMKPNAVLINTARKEVIDEQDLVLWLAAQPKASYIADVKPTNWEQLQQQYPAQVLFTPKKQGAQTLQANANAGIKAADLINCYFAEPAVLQHELMI